LLLPISRGVDAKLSLKGRKKARKNQRKR